VGQKIVNLIEIETLSADEIARKLGLKVEEIGAKLTLLLLNGEVEERDGKYGVKEL
jgi:predicted Rossmann fold nucleotide-binding protein DprA/Smf involved in DNA uptake